MVERTINERKAQRLGEPGMARDRYLYPRDAEGREVECCGPDWAALYATRVRTMMDTYRRDGAARAKGD